MDSDLSDLENANTGSETGGHGQLALSANGAPRALKRLEINHVFHSCSAFSPIKWQ